MPAALTPDHVYAQKQRAYENLETGSHWPCQEEWFSARGESQFPSRPYYKTPPELTHRQRLLYGLDRYCHSIRAAISATSRASHGTASSESAEPFLEVDSANTSNRTRRWQKQVCTKRAAEATVPAEHRPQLQADQGFPQHAAPTADPSMQLHAGDQAAKEARKLKKALREIAELERQQQDGRQMRRNQLKKVDMKAEINARLLALGTEEKENEA